MCTHRLRNPGHGPPLEPPPRIPLHPKRDLHPPLKLRPARVRERQIPHEIPRRLPVLLLRHDHVRLPGVFPLRRVDSGEVFDARWSAGRRRQVGATPGALEGKGTREYGTGVGSEWLAYPAGQRSIHRPRRILLELLPFCLLKLLRRRLVASSVLQGIKYVLR